MLHDLGSVRLLPNSPILRSRCSRSSVSAETLSLSCGYSSLASCGVGISQLGGGEFRTCGCA
eukprot:3370811-Amphidinium_carterae.1